MPRSAWIRTQSSPSASEGDAVESDDSIELELKVENVLNKYGASLCLVSAPPSLANSREALRRIASADLSSVTFEVFQLLCHLQSYPFDSCHEDPMMELKVRLDCQTCNIDSCEDTYWDDEVSIDDYRPTLGVQWVMLEGKSVAVFERAFYSSVESILDGLGTAPTLKLWVAVVCQQLDPSLTATGDKAKLLFNQMQAGDVEGWLTWR